MAERQAERQADELADAALDCLEALDLETDADRNIRLWLRQARWEQELETMMIIAGVPVDGKGVQ